MKLGKAKHSGGKERFKIKDGDNIYRILPPMGNLADKGVYSKYYRVVWGYKGTDGKLRPFVSPYQKNFQTQMVEVDCAAFRRAGKLKENHQALIAKKKELQTSGQQVPQQLLDLIEESKKTMMAFNIDSKHHLNAISRDGKIGLLKLGARAFKALKEVFKTLESQGVDALGVENGRFMNLHRSGRGLDTAYAVSELKEQVNVPEIGLVDKAVPHSLDSAIIGRLASEAFELDKLYPTPTSEEVAEIVAAYERSEAEGQQVVDRILGTSDNNTTPSTATTAAAPEATLEKTDVQAASVVGTTQETATTTDGTVVNTNTGEVVATPETTKNDSPAQTTTVADVQTPAATTTAEVPTGNTQNTTVTTNPAVQSDADFLAGLGVKLDS